MKTAICALALVLLFSPLSAEAKIIKGPIVTVTEKTRGTVEAKGKVKLFTMKVTNHSDRVVQSVGVDIVYPYWNGEYPHPKAVVQPKTIKPGKTAKVAVYLTDVPKGINFSYKTRMIYLNYKRGAPFDYPFTEIGALSTK